jgi:short chain dehydrogenase
MAACCLKGERNDVYNIVHQRCLAWPWPRTGRTSARAWDRVAAILRTPKPLDDLVAAHGERLWVRQLDVTDTVRMGRVVEEAFTDHERIDVVVSNAGFGVFGTTEDLTNEQVEQRIATNLTAAIHLARLVVPYLRRQGGGRIMQLSSMGGHIAFPAFSLYHATKWGIEGFFEGFAKAGRTVRHSHDVGRARHDPHQLLRSSHPCSGERAVSRGPGFPRTDPARTDGRRVRPRSSPPSSRQRCLRTHGAASCSVQTPTAWSPLH